MSVAETVKSPTLLLCNIVRASKLVDLNIRRRCLQAISLSASAGPIEFTRG